MYRISQKAFGEQTITEINVFIKWYKQFKEGKERVADEERSGRPSTSTNEAHVQKIKEPVLANHRLTTRGLADDIGISERSVNTILKDVMGFRRVDWYGKH